MDENELKIFMEYYGDIVNYLCFEIPMKIILNLLNDIKLECD